MRKFVRNRMAMAASVVIGVYLLIAVAVVFGAIPLEDCRERVLPGRAYGWLQEPDQEDRYDELRWYVTDRLSPVLSEFGSLTATTAMADERGQRVLGALRPGAPETEISAAWELARRRVLAARAAADAETGDLLERLGPFEPDAAGAQAAAKELIEHDPSTAPDEYTLHPSDEAIAEWQRLNELLMEVRVNERRIPGAQQQIDGLRTEIERLRSEVESADPEILSRKQARRLARNQARLERMLERAIELDAEVAAIHDEVAANRARFDAAVDAVPDWAPFAPILIEEAVAAYAQDRARALGSVALAERAVVDLPDAQLRERWEALSAAFEQLDEAWVERENLRYEITDILLYMAEVEDPEERASLQLEIDDLQPELARLDTAIATNMELVEPRLLEVLPIPDGWDGLKYGFRTFLGSDDSGRSVAVRAFYSIKIAFQVGLVAALMAVAIGTILGGLAGFYGSWVDAAIMWLVSVLSSVPYLVLLAVLIYVVRGNSLFSSWFDNPQERPGLALVPVYAAFGLTFWIGTCRVIRGEVMKIKELEYVQAATAIGLGRFRILLKHVIPNTTHIMFINFSLIFIGAIKSEVILSFLGLGVQGQPSWGVMISLGREDVQNFFFWTVLSATALMFGLVLAFNIVSDALQDAFDPKHV